jgi:hypothetical protein
MSQQLEFTVRFDATDEDLEEVDRATRQLLQELRDEPVESAELVGAKAPPGTKGLEAAAAEIAVIVLPAAIKILMEKLTRKRVTIRFEGRLGGNPVKFEGAAADFAQMLSVLNDSVGKKR